MKKLIIIFVLFLYAGIANAQTEAETLEWLNAKKVEVAGSKSHTVDYANDYENKNELSIDGLHISLKNTQGAFTNLKWSEIKDIQLNSENNRIIIVSNRMYEGENSYIALFTNKTLAPKFIKALKHMATLKGAKLIDDDLFGE